MYKKYLTNISEEKHGIYLGMIIKESNTGDFSEDKFLKMSEDEKQELSRIGEQYFDLIKEIVTVLAKKNDSEEVFYNRLHKNIFSLDMIPEDDSIRGIILFFLARRIKLLPYYQATLKIELSNDDIDTFISKYICKLNAARSILNRRSLTNREEATQLWHIASDIKNDKDIVIFWTVVISMIRRNEENDSDDSEE